MSKIKTLVMEQDELDAIEYYASLEEIKATPSVQFWFNLVEYQKQIEKERQEPLPF